ncbi:MAG: AGE family epimerase/isomerase [Thermoguttaceae bacterium]
MEAATPARQLGNGQLLPRGMGGLSLESLREDYRRRLFDEYLPFWERGGYDRERGGFFCELNDDGSVAVDEKNLWYQGRALWVYSFLYANFGKEQRWLDMAAKTREFLVEHLHAGRGKWVEKVRGDGTILDGVARHVYGWLFAAGGLAQYCAATGDLGDLDLASQSIRAAIEAYDDPNYFDAVSVQYAAVPIPDRGVRSQGHSMDLLWALSQLLSVRDDPQLAELQRRQIELLSERFWNPEYGIVNEFLEHDYARIPGAECHMYAGHAIETLGLLLHETVRTKDRALFDLIAARVRRVVEMCWDYVFDGWAGGDCFVFATPQHSQGPDYSVKTMWSQCEILIACLTILEYTGQAWAKEWYDRVRAFTLRTMPVARHGVWRQAVDRRGNDIKRAGISTTRKDNFHQVRMLMLNLLTLDRMIRNERRLTPFPR